MEFGKILSVLPFMFICSCCIILIQSICDAADSINSSETIRDGETLVSRGGMFALGFFSPTNSTTNRYVGIWYNNIAANPSEAVVWVANRENPLTTTSGVLSVAKSGSLFVVENDSGSIIWSTFPSRSVQNPIAQLLDSGKLVIKDADDSNPDKILWQSFDYPSDTYISGMSLGSNLATGQETFLTAWTAYDDPAPSQFTAHLDPAGYPQMLFKRGQDVQYRFGPWNGLGFSGAPAATPNNPTLRMTSDEVEYREDQVDPAAVTKLRLSPNGGGMRWTWNYGTSSWIINDMVTDSCDGYNLCGANAVCGGSLPCRCLRGFENTTQGCVRKTPLKCVEGTDGFLKLAGIKLPDSRNSSFSYERKGIVECMAECLKNCSCTAYAQLDIREGGTGCLFYHGDFLDIRTLAQGGQNLYIRLPIEELPIEELVSGSGKKKRVIFITVFTSAAGMFLFCLILIFIRAGNRKKKEEEKKKVPMKKKEGISSANRVKAEADLPFLKLSTILKATDNFSVGNKLGQGGFGPVYKGKLEDGQEIAVKRLSKISSQGVDELKNEVVLIAKLQHRNLVRILGCCIEREENMLIYEYMPNNSLDLILFDQTKNMLLDWGKRFHIINGIAKGLLYLHQDSMLRIIHRDLKASNVLLDADLNPKISDFGLARCFGGNETEIQTRRVVGTYGYMAPEYAIDGLFSVKSDVFSFGVLMLEIVSGKRNRGFFNKDQNLNLLGHAWSLYKEERSHELVDASLGASFDLSQALRSIHVGLLCMQKSAKDRPSMSSVVFMLGNEVALPQAKELGFLTDGDVPTSQNCIDLNAANSDNQVTITWPEGR